MTAFPMADRAVVEVAGVEARDFLQGLVTCDMARVGEGRPRAGALLSAQGKVLVDFIVAQARDADGGECFRLDAPRERAADLVKRLALYKLRRAVTIRDRSAGEDALAVVVETGDAPTLAGAFADPRAPGLGFRAHVDARAAPAEDGAARQAWERARIEARVPAGGVDFAHGEAFPHDIGLDAQAGVDFDKGCYVGQEVVSRMQHRGGARKRPFRLRFAGAAPPAGTEVRAGEILLGALGGSSGEVALAILRADKLDDARANGTPVIAGGMAAEVE